MNRMNAFSVKEVEERTLGDALREARTARGETFDDVERATHVSKKYVQAFESNDFGRLPEAVYGRKFAKRLAEHYGLDAQAIVEELLRGMTVVTGPEAPRHPANFVEGRRLMVAPSVVKAVLGALALLAVLGYFAWSVRQILKPPTVTLYAPMDKQQFPTGRVAIEGLTEPGVELAVNGEPILIEADGVFKDILNLPAGVSDLRISAKKKHSREREIFLQVVVEGAPTTDATPTEETAPAEPIAVPSAASPPKPSAPIAAPPAVAPPSAPAGSSTGTTE